MRIRLSTVLIGCSVIGCGLEIGYGVIANNRCDDTTAISKCTSFAAQRWQNQITLTLEILVIICSVSKDMDAHASLQACQLLQNCSREKCPSVCLQKVIAGIRSSE